MIIFQPISVMEKCFTDEDISAKRKISKISGLKGEECAFQVAYVSSNPEDYPKTTLYLEVVSPIKEFITVRSVEQVPVRYACQSWGDDDFLRKEPGFYPDLLLPLDDIQQVFVTYRQLKSLYVTVVSTTQIEAGDYDITLLFKNDRGEEQARVTLPYHCINAQIPEQTMDVTQWFHTDCIANYYNLETYSETHWQYIESFMKTAVANGINTILTPVFTPPLDTAVGHERRTVQLVDVKKTESGWEFGFDKLERFLNIGLRVGVKNFEISHLYTQWGAAHAPKIMGTDEKGEYKRLFGWETDALSEEYKTFLRSFLTALLQKGKKMGIDERFMFHISDEPNKEQLDSYKKAKEQIADILKGHRIMDALSDFHLFTSGAVDCPIPDTGAAEPFLEANIPDLWVYYCCGLHEGVSNRFIAMGMDRTRVIGTQFYKYHIKGFLQWGYNFYSSCGSIRSIDPYLITDGDFWVPAGDCFSVYPGFHGIALESLHLKAFTLALQDVRVFQLAQKLTSYETVMGIIEQKGEISFLSAPKEHGWVESIREQVNQLIEENL